MQGSENGRVVTIGGREADSPEVWRLYSASLATLQKYLQGSENGRVVTIGLLTLITGSNSRLLRIRFSAYLITRIIQSLYYSPANRCINAWMHSLKKSVKPEIVNRYDLWVLRHKIGGAKVFVNNVQWSDQMM